MLKKLKDGKAVGPDGIPYEIYSQKRKQLVEGLIKGLWGLKVG